MTMNPDLSRIQQAKDNRRNQLIEWEIYDRKMGDVYKENIEPRPSKVGFGSDVIFLEVAARGDLEEVRELLKKGVDPNVVNEDGLTALHQSCIDNNIEMCTLLLENSANVNATDNELWTPLHAAAACGHKKLCSLLIDWGADLLAINVEGNMPYDLCNDDDVLIVVESEMSRRNVTQAQIDEIRLRPEHEMLEDLIKRRNAKDNLNALDSQGAAPLHIACACGFVEVAKFLLQSNADVHVPDQDGWLPIHIAVCWGQVEIIEILVSYGADMESSTRSGQTVYTICDSDELAERLHEIWDRREELRIASTMNNVGFQRSRGSSRRRSSTNVMRSSMRDKRNLSRMEAKREKQIGMEAEAKLIQDKENGIDDAHADITPPPRNSPISLLSKTNHIVTETDSVLSEKANVTSRTVTGPKAVVKPQVQQRNDIATDITEEKMEEPLPVRPPDIPPRENMDRNSPSPVYSRESPTITSSNSSPPTSSSITPTLVPRKKTNKESKPPLVARPAEVVRSPKSSLNSYSNTNNSGGIKSPYQVPSRDSRVRVSRETPSVDVPHPNGPPPPLRRKEETKVPIRSSPKNNILLREGPQTSTIYSTSDAIPAQQVNMSKPPASSLSLNSTDTLNSNSGVRRKPLTCCRTM